MEQFILVFYLSSLNQEPLWSENEYLFLTEKIYEIQPLSSREHESAARITTNPKLQWSNLVKQSCQAMVFNGPNQPLKIQSFSLPDLVQDELLVRVLWCTICGSDLHTYTGRRTVPTPTILGHEIVGRIIEFGPSGQFKDIRGENLQKGDRITWCLSVSCGQCFYCKVGLSNKCSLLFKYGHEPVHVRSGLSGGLAEFCHLKSGTACLKIPDPIPDLIACPLNCAVATVSAAFRKAGSCRDQVVLVLGAGLLGIMASAMACHDGARAIIVCDPKQDRIDYATRFGATHTLATDKSDTSLRSLIRKVTDDRGPDICFEMCGFPESVTRAIDLLRIGGKLILVGSVFPTEPAAIVPQTIVNKLLTIQGVHNYLPEDLCAGTTFLATTYPQFPFSELVSQTYPLSQAQRAIMEAVEGRGLRCAVTPD